MSTTRPNGLSSTPRTRSACAGSTDAPASASEPAAFEALARVKVTVSVKVAPPPRRCVTTMSPPIARAICFTDDSPSPAPPKRDAMLTLACENGRNSRLISPSVSPIPLSETAKATPTLPLAPRIGFDRQRDAARFGELRRIVDQVFQRRAQANGIANHHRRKLLRNLDPGIADPSPPPCRRANRRRCAPVPADRRNPAAPRPRRGRLWRHRQTMSRGWRDVPRPP